MDFIFSGAKTGYEFGCGECALTGGANTTKELYDASYKLPLVMKDMAISLLSLRPSIMHDLTVVGLYVGGKYSMCVSPRLDPTYISVIETRLQLKTMDFPSAHVARVDSFDAVAFLKIESEIGRALPAVLQTILGAKLLMETSKRAVEQCRDPVVISKLCLAIVVTRHRSSVPCCIISLNCIFIPCIPLPIHVSMNKSDFLSPCY